jgi:hypothetical protein
MCETGSLDGSGNASRRVNTANPMSTFTAYSISTTVCAWLRPHPRQWRVVSTHSHACYLLSDDGKLVALASPRHGNGPFHVVVPGIIFAGMAQDEIVHSVDGQLLLNAGSIDIRGAELWSPRLPQRAIDRSAKSLGQHDRLRLCENESLVGDAASDPLLPQFHKRAHSALQALQAGWHHADFRQIEEGVIGLAGLGPGLTPAGDDLLVGWLAGIFYCGERCDLRVRAEMVGRRIATTAAPRTTRLSATWLRHAGVGEFAESWHALAHGLDSGATPAVECAVRRILNTGATSGQAAMTGFCHAQQLFAEATANLERSE